jgi:GGDEF domain-containing protein
VLCRHPRDSAESELWGMRTLAALLERTEPVRIALAGDPLAGGGRTALLTAPVPAGGGSIGVVVARRVSGKAFTVADADALARLARACGARLQRTAERTAVAASSVDPATRLGSHELLMRDLADALEAMPVHGLPATLVVAEVVGLARLRTAHGMPAADAAVSRAAALIGGRLRVGDVLYRMSADELAVLLPATDVDGGTAVAARLADLSVPDDPATPGGDLTLRPVAVPVRAPAEKILLDVVRGLAAARVNERWREDQADRPPASKSSSER